MNRKFLADVGLCDNAEDFQVAVSFASWGTASSALPEHKRRLGLQVRRLLDLGRLLYLRNDMKLPNAKMLPYVAFRISPDNMVLLAGGDAC